MEQREFIVEAEGAGQRIDRFLSGEDTGLSRSALQAPPRAPCRATKPRRDGRPAGFFISGGLAQAAKNRPGRRIQRSFQPGRPESASGCAFQACLRYRAEK